MNRSKKPMAGRRLVAVAVAVVAAAVVVVLISRVLVKWGDVVKAEQLPSQADDRLERITLTSYRLDEDSTAEVDYDSLDVQMKQLQARRRAKLYATAGHNISLAEVQDADNAVLLSQAQLKVAQLHYDQKRLDYQKQVNDLRLKVRQ